MSDDNGKHGIHPTYCATGPAEVVAGARTEGGCRNRVVRPEAKEDNHASRAFCTLLLRCRGLAAETARVTSFSDREHFRGWLMPVLQFSVRVATSLLSSTSPAPIRRHGSCLFADANLKFRRSKRSCLLTSPSTLCCQTWSRHWLAGHKQDRNRKSDNKPTSDECKPSKSSLRADRRKRHKRHGYEVFAS